MSKAIAVKGVGRGQTTLAAFDDALREGGIHNYNLVELSSMLPTDTTVRTQERYDASHAVGALLPTVLAEERSATEGETIAAGIGWQQTDDGGILAEHTASSYTECRNRLSTTLTGLRRHRDDWDEWTSPTYCIAETTVGEDAASALVAVVLPDLSLDGRNI